MNNTQLRKGLLLLLLLDKCCCFVCCLLFLCAGLMAGWPAGRLAAVDTDGGGPLQ